jgi:hypothetical protein
MTPAETIAKIFAGSESLISPIAYCSELPPFVRDWHVYLEDRGHCVMCLIEGQFDYFPADKLWEKLVAVPMTKVLPEYNIHAGMIVLQEDFPLTIPTEVVEVIQRQRVLLVDLINYQGVSGFPTLGFV